MIQRVLRREGDDPSTLKTLLMAFTGTAAYNMEGCTLHSALHLKIDTKNDYLSDAKKNTLGNKLSNVYIIIIDEISMVSSDLLK